MFYLAIRLGNFHILVIPLVYSLAKNYGNSTLNLIKQIWYEERCLWDEVKKKGMRPKGNKAFVNQHMREAYEKEFHRMKKYMYRDSTSSTSSRMLVADKATPPYVRICGDYRDVKIPQHYIPNIRHEIEKARGFNHK